MKTSKQALESRARAAKRNGLIARKSRKHAEMLALMKNVAEFRVEVSMLGPPDAKWDWGKCGDQIIALMERFNIISPDEFEKKLAEFEEAGGTEINQLIKQICRTKIGMPF